MQYACDFIAEHNDDDQRCHGDNALHGPRGDNQTHIDGKAFDHPEHGDGHDHTDDIGAAEQHVKAEKDIAIEQDVSDILPAQSTEK